MDMVAAPGFSATDQWQVQVQAMIQKKADVHILSEGLTSNQITKALLKPCYKIETTLKELEEKYGSDCTICVIPDGPLTVAYLDD
jgi:nickel-dependent lactate racemase